MIFSDAEIRQAYQNGKNGKRQRSPRDYPFKKRKPYGYAPVSNTDVGISSDGACRSPKKGSSGDGSGTMLPRGVLFIGHMFLSSSMHCFCHFMILTSIAVTGESNSAAGEHSAFLSKNSPGMGSFYRDVISTIHFLVYGGESVGQVLMFLSFYAVKLKIKSFRVPEFFIEISETATVGSLKVFALPMKLMLSLL